MRLALQIKTNGEIVRLDLDAPEGSYKVLNAGVGGWIEAVALADNLTMYVNEEGKIDGLPRNPIASDHFDKVFGAGKDVIVGNVVFTGGVDDEGDDLGLTDEAVLYLMGVAV